jgi:hypothetical protein
LNGKKTKQEAKKIQLEILKDTHLANDVIRKAQDLGKVDDYWRDRELNFEHSSSTVGRFIEALSYKATPGNLTKDITGNKTNSMLTGASFTSKMIISPIISSPVDVYILVKESEKIYKKEPSNLSMKLQPIVNDLQNQLVEDYQESMIQKYILLILFNGFNLILSAKL